MQLVCNWMGAQVLCRPPFEKLLNANHLLLLVPLHCLVLGQTMHCTTLRCHLNADHLFSLHCKSFALHWGESYCTPKCHLYPPPCCTALLCTCTKGSHTALQNAEMPPFIGLLRLACPHHPPCCSWLDNHIEEVVEWLNEVNCTAHLGAKLNWHI